MDMKQKLLLLTMLLLLGTASNTAFARTKIVKITVEPPEAAIYVDNTFLGNGFGEFPCPKKKNSVAVIRIECDGYLTINTKFYGGDKRESLHLVMQPDGFINGTEASGAVNKFFTIEVNKKFYTEKADGTYDTKTAWKMLHQILLNYFDEIESTDFYSGYVQTPWHYTEFTMSDKQVRNRVVIRDISNPEVVAFQIKILSEVAATKLGKHGEFVEIDRIPRELAPLIQELQTRIGKLYSF
jgi:hypothetical protein